MKVFISWSGEPSHTVAVALREWLPSVIQRIEPYVSSVDLEKGAPWFTKIAQELNDTAFGIICVTRANADSRWLNFEAGALFKSIKDAESRVCPLLIDLKPVDLKGPLAQLQMTEPTRDDVSKLLRSLNASDEPPLRGDILNVAIDKFWPDLEEQLRAARRSAESQVHPEPRDPQDLIEQILEISRGLQRRIPPTIKVAQNVGINVRTSEQEGYRKKKIYDNVWEILHGAGISHRILSVHENTVEVEVYYLADLPKDVKATLAGLAKIRGLAINVTTIEHPDPEYVHRP
jgi:hypothetical protein